MAQRLRINRGIPELRGPMLIMEGARHNLLPSDPFSSKDCAPSIVGAETLGPRQHPKFPDVPMWTFKVIPGVPFHIGVTARCPESILGYTFSTFAEISYHDPLLLKATLGDDVETKCDNLLVTQTVTRFEVPHEFASTPVSISISLDGEIPVGDKPTPVMLGLAFVTVEEGLFASTPIPPADPIGFRGGEQLSYERADNFFEGRAGTLTLFFAPAWTGPQLGAENTAFLIDCMTGDQQNSVSIYADGTDYGKLKATIVASGNRQTLSTDIIPVRGILYSVALRWAAGLAEVIVNGRTAASSDVIFPDAKSLGKSVYIGSTARSPNLSAFSTLSNVSCYPEWLSDEYLRAIIFETYPLDFGQFMPDWENITNRPSVELIKTGSWGFQFALVLLRYIPRLWQEHPPLWLLQAAIDEAHCRDEILRFLSGRDWDSISEYATHEGRTDLVVQDKYNQNRMLRIEFKVWGRNDYKDVPEKPLKYFSDHETIAIVLMINPSKKKRIGDEYRHNVKSSPTDCIGTIEKPFGAELFPDHFVSLHARAGARAEVLHIVLNRQAPFAVKDLPGDT